MASYQPLNGITACTEMNAVYERGREGEGGREGKGEKEREREGETLVFYHHIPLYIFPFSSDVEVTTREHNKTSA